MVLVLLGGDASSELPEPAAWGLPSDLDALPHRVPHAPYGARSEPPARWLTGPTAPWVSCSPRGPPPTKWPVGTNSVRGPHAKRGAFPGALPGNEAQRVSLFRETAGVGAEGL